eukprot:COSAG02_NODE_34_length_49821_cov_105.420438_47_plen_55_part_00
MDTDGHFRTLQTRIRWLITDIFRREDGGWYSEIVKYDYESTSHSNSRRFARSGG